MKFDVKYPKAQRGDMPEPGIYFGKFPRTCSCCGVQTSWMDFDFKQGVCSEECLAKIILDYARSSDPGLLRLLSVDLSKSVPPS